MTTFAQQIKDKSTEGSFIYRAKGPSRFDGQFLDEEWQVRIPVQITSENVKQFAEGLDRLIDDSTAWPLTKLFNPGKDAPLPGLINHSSHATDRDQCGKNVCIYIKKNNQDETYFKSDAIKNVVLKVIGLAKKLDIGFISRPCPLDERALSCDVDGYLPAFYSSYKPFKLVKDRDLPGKRHGILMCETYNPCGYADPLADTSITNADLIREGLDELPKFDQAAEGYRIGAAKNDWLSTFRKLVSNSQVDGEHPANKQSHSIDALLSLPECPRFADADFSSFDTDNDIVQMIADETSVSQQEFLAQLADMNLFFGLDGEQRITQASIRRLFQTHPHSMQKLFRQYHRINNAKRALDIDQFKSYSPAQQRSKVKENIRKGGSMSKADVLTVLHQYKTYIANRRSSYRGLRIFFKSISKQDKLAAVIKMIRTVSNTPEDNLESCLNGMSETLGLDSRAAHQGLLGEILTACQSRTAANDAEGPEAKSFL